MKNNTTKNEQIYDRTLKSLMEDHAAEMLPEFLPETVFCEEKNIEIVRMNLRADIVYIILYRGRRCVLHMELQTVYEIDMPFRMLQYHVELHEKHKLPVISIVVYLFKTSVPEPVFHEMLEEETLLRFEHQVLKLWEVEAEQYLRRHMVSMYTLLPAMKGVTKEMLIQAIGEMTQCYEGRHLGHHLSRFQKILRRTTMISEQDKAIVEERLRTYDKLIDEDPEVQQRMAWEKAKGEERGLEKGKIEGQQRIVLSLVEARFPNLLETARERITHIDNSDDLILLNTLMALVPDAASAGRILSRFAQ